MEHERDLCLVSIYSHLIPDICYDILVNYVTVNSYQHNKSPPKKAGSTMKKVKYNTRHSGVIAEHLVLNMNTGLGKYKQILISKTQKGIQNSIHPITRK